MKKNTNAPSNPDPIVIVTSGASSSCLSLDHQTIEIEMLSRLPVKSLMRFKCVSKHWRSFIEDDPYFIDLHLTRSNKARPGLFIPSPLNRSHLRQSGEWKELLLSTADMFQDCNRPAQVNMTIRKTDLLYNTRILGPVNGLVCFLDDSVYAVQIYNVSTREVTPWISSPVRMKAKRESADGDIHCVRGGPECQFGFDPVTKEHKVVHVWNMYVFGKKHILDRKTEREKRIIIEEYNVCDVLTVGDNTWRIVEEVPPFPLNHCKVGVYANGSIYWYRREYDGFSDEDTSEFLVVFDIGSEKFRRVPIPIPCFKNLDFSSISLLEVDGGVAILRTVGEYPCIAEMWIFYDNDKKEKETTSNPNSKKLWSNAVTITFPFDVAWQHPFNFRSVAGTDQIIIETNTGPKRQGDGVKKKICTFALSWIYSYNWKKNTMTEVDIDGISALVPFRYSPFLHIFWSTFVESLLPVRKKLQRHHGCTHPPQAK